MLYIIGLGLADVDDLTVKGLRIIKIVKKCIWKHTQRFYKSIKKH